MLEDDVDVPSSSSNTCTSTCDVVSYLIVRIIPFRFDNTEGYDLHQIEIWAKQSNYLYFRHSLKYTLNIFCAEFCIPDSPTRDWETRVPSVLFFGIPTTATTMFHCNSAPSRVVSDASGNYMSNPACIALL
jgi:hypothetical protein